ncbi:hypothetical protein [Acinetobacter sp. 2JN-4]|uniref:hypothetical protein n=1 Tax=Acinetobacter sp. 2JN-4 TaxID=2479844 RepID=UPI00148C3EF1|nr:hypothetical protein [Acinetobacter sp. 2JN-4]
MLKTMKVTIQCTAHPPVKRTGHFDYIGSSGISQMHDMDEIPIAPRLKQDCLHRKNRIKARNWILQSVVSEHHI